MTVTTLVERLDLPAALSRARSRRDTETDTARFAQAALAAAKREGLQLAVRARYVALAVIACLLPIINPSWAQLYYLAILGLFALIGWLRSGLDGSACQGRSLGCCSATSRC